jgi:hypothetical protein
MRDRFAWLHPRSSDSVLLSGLKSIDLLLQEGIAWINREVITTSTAEGKLDVFYEAIKNWIAARQQDSDSLYYAYGAGQ